MSQEEIIAMAREAGCVSAEFWPKDFAGLMGVFERFAALVAAKEREACAQVCDVMKTAPPRGEPDDVERGYNAALKRCAASIRARSRP